MGVYVDVPDIRQHVRQSGALTDETINELMREQEYYVETVLNIPSLPPDNPLLKNIIRDLTIAAAIYAIVPVSSDDVGKANFIRAEALRKLSDADREGIGIVRGSQAARDASTEIRNLYASPFWTPSDFNLGGFIGE